MTKPSRAAVLLGLCGLPGCLQPTLEVCTDDYCPVGEPATSTTTGAPPIEPTTGATSTTGGSSTTSGTSTTTGTPADAPPAVMGFTVNGSSAPAEVGEPSFVALVATASDDHGIAEVRFYDGETLLGTSTAGPEFAFSWLVDSGMNGQHALRAVAVDEAAQESAPATVPLSVFMVGGKAVWTRVLPLLQTENSYATSVGVDPDDDIVVSGKIGPGTQPLLSDDMWLRKYDPDGGLLWELPYGPMSSHSPQKLVVDANGGLYLGGTTIPVKAMGFAWLAAFDNDGTHRWTDEYKAENSSTGSVAVSRDGTSVVITGHEANSALWLRRYDGAGQVLWTAPQLPFETSRGVGVAIDEHGDLYVLGTVADTLQAFDKLWLQKRSAAGEVQWTRTLGKAKSSSSAGGLVLHRSGLGVSGRIDDADWFGVYSSAGELLVERLDLPGEVAASDSKGNWLFEVHASQPSGGTVAKYSAELELLWESSPYLGEEGLGSTIRDLAVGDLDAVIAVGEERATNDAVVGGQRGWIRKYAP